MLCNRNESLHLEVITHVDNVAQVSHRREAVPVQVRRAQQLQQGLQQQQRPGQARADSPGSGRGEFVCLLTLFGCCNCLFVAFDAFDEFDAFVAFV